MAILGTSVLRRQLGEATRRRWALGLRAGSAVGLPLLIGTLAGHSSWGALASMGGFAGFYVPAAPLRYRVLTVAWVGLALTIVVPVSGLLATTAWLAIVWVGVVALLASFACLALEIPPPREYLIVLATLAGTGIPQTGSGALWEAWLVAAGALIALGIGVLAAALRRGPDPVRTAVHAGWEATLNVLAAAGTSQAQGSREAAVRTVRQARTVLGQAGAERARECRRRQVAVEIVLAAALSVSIDAIQPLDAQFISAITQSGPAPEGPLPGAPPALAAALGRAGQAFDAGDGEVGGEPAWPAPLGAITRLHQALGGNGIMPMVAARIGVTVAAGAGIGRLLGLDHSYWVGLTCAAALQANNVTLLLRRSLNRLTGTAVGLGLAAGLLAISRAGVFVAVLAGLAQAIAETVIAASYAVGITFVTVVALSIYELALPGGGRGAVIGARLLDTAIGAALVVLLRLALWPRASAARLPRAQSDALRATADLFHARWLNQALDLAPLQHRLQDDVLRLRTLAEDARGDRIPGPGIDPAEEDPITVAVSSLATLALSVPYGRPAPEARAAAVYVGAWRELADALSGPGRTRPVSLADLPGYPRTAAATRMLAVAVASRPAQSLVSSSIRRVGNRGPTPT